MNLFQAKEPLNLPSLEWLNFFLADVQTGVGPFLAAYLASDGWSPERVGFALTFGGLVTACLQVPAGAMVDVVHRKRMLLAINLGVLVAGAMLLIRHPGTSSVYLAQGLIGGSAAFLGPTVAAITLGIVGARAFDQQFGRNQSFNSAGNVCTALLIAWVSYRFGYRTIFAITAVLAIPALLSLLAIDGDKINYARARGGENGGARFRDGIASLLRDRVLIAFLFAALLFHIANAAMLPLLGEMLAKDNLKAAGPFMSACVVVTQLVIATSAAWVGRRAGEDGRRPLLLLGFGLLPIRGVLYVFMHATAALIAVQVLDGVANCIFGVVSMLVIADRARGTGHFNLAAGSLATVVGIGAGVSNAIGGALIQGSGYSASFLALAAVGLVGFGVLWLGVPETQPMFDQPVDTCIPAHTDPARNPTVDLP